MVELQKYWVEKTDNDREIVRGVFDSISFVDGLCRAHPTSPLTRRDLRGYDSEVLAALIQVGAENGGIGDGSKGYDDRKMRYDGASEEGDNLVVRLGHSHFREYLESRHRPKEEGDRLELLGEEIYGDRFAFFPRNPGVTGLVRTNDGKIIVGYRTSEGDPVFDGLVQGAAAHLNYADSPAETDVSARMKETYKAEFGIDAPHIQNMEFLGLFSFADQHGDDLDFGWLADVDLNSGYFTGDSWRSHADKPHHERLIAIPHYEALEDLNNEGRIDNVQGDVVFSTRGPLEQLTRDDFP